MLRRFIIALAASLAACGGDPEPPRSRGADVLLRPDTETIVARVPARATLESLLLAHQLPVHLVHAVVESARGVFNPRQLRAERPYRLVRTLDGLFREFEYQIDADRFLRIVSPDRSKPERLEAQVLPYEKQTSVTAIRGAITAERPSLVAAMDGTGEEIQLAMALAEIFNGQIDFNNDLQRGDTFEVLFEKSTRDGEFAGYGAILGASFTVEGREHRAFRWVHPGTQKAGYYDENGRSLKRQLLISPLKYDFRVTSGFSRSRLHPVHRTRRPHLGVDYGAPHGSAVVAVADGVVVSAGWSGAGGNMVRLRHSGGLETYYLHLSSIAKGVRRGARVEQNQIIGRVGSTGTATGPHLDYRMKRNGVFVNPITAHRQQPPGEPIPAAQLASFRAARDSVVDRLSTALLAAAPPRPPDAINASAPGR